MIRSIPAVLWHSRKNLLGATGDLLWLAMNNLASEYVSRYMERIRTTTQYYHSEPDPILIYTMYKVGSRTVRATLEETLGHRILHQHFLCDSNRKRHDATMTSFASVFGASYSPARRMANTRYLNALLNQQSGKRWKVIVMVREPIARNLSLFFYMINNVQHSYLAEQLSEDEVGRRISLLLGLFDKYRKAFSFYEMLFTWFDSELRASFGVDVFREDFSHGQGYKMYRGERADVLLLRLENLNTCYHLAFKEFLQLDIPELISTNSSVDGGYGETYRRFKDLVYFPGEYIEHIYDLKYVRHFYTEQEIAYFKTRWTGKDT